MSAEKNSFAVFVSGYGRGAIEIIKQHNAGEINPMFSLLISTDPLSHAIECARKAGVSVCVIEKGRFGDRNAFETEILQSLARFNIRNVFLAGFKYLLSESFLDAFHGEVLNIHPSLLPAFKGHKNGIQQALEYGVKVTGITIHKINKEMDEGEILYQTAVRVQEWDDFLSLDKKIFSEGVELTKAAINERF